MTPQFHPGPAHIHPRHHHPPDTSRFAGRRNGGLRAVSWDQPPFWRRDYSWVGIWTQFRGTCLVTAEFLVSPRWHGDRSLPVWCRGRESFRLPLSAVDTESALGACRHQGLVAMWVAPRDRAGCSVDNEKPDLASPQPGEHSEHVLQGPQLQTPISRHFDTPFHFSNRFAKPLHF